MTARDFVGPERREEPDLRVLQNDIAHVREMLEKIEKRLEEMEKKQNDSCKSCHYPTQIKELSDKYEDQISDLWEEVIELQKENASARGWALGISAGISTLITVATFLGQWLLHKP